ncbi:MAG: glycoside hydrolase family 3 N-terminal domain-containing protein, partial [bacterium]
MKKGIIGKVIKTILSLILTLILAVLMFAANVILPGYDRMANSILNGFNRTVDNKGAAAEGLDLDYNKADYTKESIGAAEDALAKDIASEGLVLLKNEDSALPVSGDTVFSL